MVAAQKKIPAPTATLARKQPSEFIGATGTTIYGGYYSEEYLNELRGKAGCEVYDEMRRSDAQVKMILSAIKNPIKSSTFAHEPVKGDAESEKIAEFLDWQWFKCDHFDFGQFLAEALTFLEFGFSIFEKLYRVSEHPELGLVHTLRSLGFRKQATIERWLVDPARGLTGVEQYAYGDTVRSGAHNCVIPIEHLIVFTNDKEGDNHEGTSLLRACYGAWFRKNLYLKLNAIGIEKASIGVPVGKYPKGTADSSELDKFIACLQNFAVHENSYLLFPDGYHCDIVKNDFDSEKVLESIRYEDAQMSKSILFQFLELGTNSSSGSFALGADQSDIALSAIQFIGDMVCQKVNEINRELVAMNFGPVANIPKVKCTGINQKAGREVADIIKVLVEAGAIKADEGLEEHVRKLYALPKKAEDAGDTDDEDETAERPTKPDLKVVEQKPVVEAAEKRRATCLSETGELVPFRPLTKYEAVLNLAENVREFDAEHANLHRTMKARLALMAEQAIRNLGRMIAKKDQSRAEAAANLRVEYASYRKALQQALGSIVALGSEQAHRELTKKLGDKAELAESFARNTEYLPEHVKAALVLQSEMQAEAQATELRKRIAFKVMSAEDGNLDNAKLIAQLETDIEAYIASNAVESAARTMTAQAINRGRDGFFFDKKNLRDIQGFQYSAVLDSSTTDICLALDQKVFKPGEQDDSLRPPNHHGCRSILIPITVREDKPDYTGLDVDPTNPSLVDEYERRGSSPPDLATIKKSRNI